MPRATKSSARKGAGTPAPGANVRREPDCWRFLYQNILMLITPPVNTSAPRVLTSYLSDAQLKRLRSALNKILGYYSW
jgi:hypothetical protein